MAGLSAKDLTQIKDVLAGGKRPRVMFTEAAGQIAGQLGQVVQLDDPDVHDEWILVKFGSDVLPFSPADLALPPRGSSTKKPEQAKETPQPAAPPEPEFMVVRETVPPKNHRSEARETVPQRAPETPKPVVKPAPDIDDQPARQESSPVSEAADAPAATPAPRKPAAAKPAKPKGPAGLTVTLAYTEGEWTVGAIQGSKALAKPYVIKPAEALKMVSMLDVPGVHEAVESILTAERTQAQAHAEKLRAELAELEAKLAELGA